MASATTTTADLVITQSLLSSSKAAITSVPAATVSTATVPGSTNATEATFLSAGNTLSSTPELTTHYTMSATNASIASFPSGGMSMSTVTSATTSTHGVTAGPGLTDSQLAAAIAVPVIVAVIGIAIALFFAIRIIRRRRATAGKYSPNRMEVSQQTVITSHFVKPPPPERLI